VVLPLLLTRKKKQEKTRLQTYNYLAFLKSSTQVISELTQKTASTFQSLGWGLGIGSQTF